MTSEPKQPDDRLESMLRRWGAEEAARNAQPAAPVIRPDELTPSRAAAADGTVLASRSASRRPLLAEDYVQPRRSWAWRWGPLAAAAAVLVFALGLLLAGPLGRLGSGREPLARAPQTDGFGPGGRDGSAAPGDPAVQQGAPATVTRPATEQQLAELAELKHAVAELRDLADRREQSQSQAIAHAAAQDQRVEELTQANGQLAQRLASLQAQYDAKQQTYTQQAAIAQQSADQLATLQKQLDEARKRIEELDRLRGVEVRLAAAVDELTRTQQQRDAALADARSTEEQLLRARAAMRAAWADMEHAYLAAAAPGLQDLAAYQAAVRNTRLLARAAELRKTVRREGTREILDQAEAALTRLSLLSANDPRARDALTSHLRSRKIVEGIDEALESPETPPAVRSWLVEARLVLGGVQRLA